MNQFQKATLVLLTTIARQLDAGLRDVGALADSDKIRNDAIAALRTQAPSVFAAINGALNGAGVDVAANEDGFDEYDTEY